MYQENVKEKKLMAIYDALSPSSEAHDLDVYLNSEEPIPTRQIGYQEFERLLDQARHLVQIQTETADADETEDSEEEEDYFEERSVFNDIAENNRWRVVEFSYLKLWSAWGMLLVFDKEKEQWTSFYSSSAGDNHMMLYLDDQVELVDGQLSGKFDPYAQQRVTITLPEFRVRKAHQYAFGDYPVESLYTGSIAPLNTKSSDFASTFPTRIRAALKDGVNFAGHYSVMMAGCGTQCQMIAITDAISGDVITGLNSQAGVEFNAASQLLIVNASINCLEEDYFLPCKPRYYQMSDGELIELADTIDEG